MNWTATVCSHEYVSQYVIACTLIQYGFEEDSDMKCKSETLSYKTTKFVVPGKRREYVYVSAQYVCGSRRKKSYIIVKLCQNTLVDFFYLYIE